MPGRGLPPAENKRRRNADPYEGLQTEISAEAAVPPPLPDGYSPDTQHWYAVWCSAPQARTFQVTDWQRLHMLAPLIERYFKAPAKEIMAEIRLNESLLGATHADRLRARIKVESERHEPVSRPDEVAEKRRRRILDAS